MGHPSSQAGRSAAMQQAAQQPSANAQPSVKAQPTSQPAKPLPTGQKPIIAPLSVEELKKKGSFTPYHEAYASDEAWDDRVTSVKQLLGALSLGVADVRTANSWMIEASLEPRAQRLYGDLWYEGETCILFADTNVGKSILAVQIANAIAMGEEPFIPNIEIETGRQPVLYADLELSKRQFLNRYSDSNGSPIYLSTGLVRLELNYSDWEILKDLGEKKSFEDQLLDDLEKIISTTDIKVVVVDNITFLTSCTEKTFDAMQLMKRLISFKQRFGVSLLVLAHTPKREIMRSITANDLQGSKSLINFADSAFAIGISRQDPSLRYIKQIKQRNCEQVYGADNVIVTRITTDEPIEGMLRMQFERFDSETEHASEDINRKNTRAEKIRRCRELHNQGKSIREIARELGISKSSAHEILQETPPVSLDSPTSRPVRPEN